MESLCKLAVVGNSLAIYDAGLPRVSGRTTGRSEESLAVLLTSPRMEASKGRGSYVTAGYRPSWYTISTLAAYVCTSSVLLRNSSVIRLRWPRRRYKRSQIVPVEKICLLRNVVRILASRIALLTCLFAWRLLRSLCTTNQLYLKVPFLICLKNLFVVVFECGSGII